MNYRFWATGTADPPRKNRLLYPDGRQLRSETATAFRNAPEGRCCFPLPKLLDHLSVSGKISGRESVGQLEYRGSGGRLASQGRYI